ncbi:MAG: hypothetical protein HW421_3520 [Ignavibacteria bacterium]|nr:hypothetical protein [Ignavibacteria bacterium]
MDNNILIHDLLDGNLDPSSEEQLFYALSASEEARTELKQQIAVSRAVRADIQAFSPSAKSTMNIYSSLGFNVPVAGATAVAAKSGILTTLGKFSQGIIGSLITAGVAVGLFLSFGRNSQPESVQPASSSSNLVSQQQPMQPQLPIADADKPVPEKPGTIVKYIYIPAKVVENSDAAANPVQQNAADLTKEESLVPDYAKTIILTPLSKGNYPLYNPSAIGNLAQLNGKPVEMTPHYSNSGELLGFTIEVNNFQDWLLPDPNIEPSSIPKFNNLSGSILYNVSKNTSFGINLRQESFFQTFTGTDNQGDLYRYEQQPYLTSYSGVFRYSLRSLLGLEGEGFIIPMLQLSIGGNKAGTVGRIMLASSFRVNSQFAFMLGVEGGRLWYTHKNNTFTTDKIGVNYGFVYGF